MFRALVLGDMLCATPALRALKAAWPEAELTLIGLPWARELAERLPDVDRFEPFPGFPGLPEIMPDLAALPAFIARMQAARFDLVVQLHGSGSIVNPLLACFGARHTAGFCEPGDYSADAALHTVWPKTGHEIERLLALTDHLGLPRQGEQLDFPVGPEDHAALFRAVPELHRLHAPDRPDRPQGPAERNGPQRPEGLVETRGHVVIHPGAQLPSRRWLPERFAEVADALAARGLRIVLTGSAAEAPVTAAVLAQMRQPALDLTGRTSLFGFGALLKRARLVVCNDTGASHVAAAVGTASVVVSSGADVARWAPLDAQRQRVLWADVPCRPCSHRVCPYGHECASGVGAAEVVDAAFAALSRA